MVVEQQIVNELLFHQGIHYNDYISDYYINTSTQVIK